MRRIFIALFLLLCVTEVLFAMPQSSTQSIATVPMSIPSYFTPVPSDLSVWFLGNIFGSNLIESSSMPISDIKLLSGVFGVFNQVALVVAMIIVTYTVIAGSLNTASEGKALGEKWNSVWMPVRTSMGVAMLVPKGGSGYCMAQYLVMWLTLQGVGAADTVWNQMLNYFDQGGAIYSGTSGTSSSYMNKGSVDPTYTLAAGAIPSSCGNACTAVSTDLLLNMVCVAAYNADTAKHQLTGVPSYGTYAPDSLNRPDLLFFGNQGAINTKNLPPTPSTDNSTAYPGAECGYISVTNGNTQPTDVTAAQQVYSIAIFNLSQTLQTASSLVVADSNGAKITDSAYTSASMAIRQGVQDYVGYIASYAAVLNPSKASQKNAALQALGQYGWVLAGNYYTILSAYKERTAGIVGSFTAPSIAAYQAPLSGGSSAPYAAALQDYQTVFSNWGNQLVQNSNPPELTFHDIFGFGTAGTSTSSGANNNKHMIGIVDMDKLLGAINSKTYGQSTSTQINHTAPSLTVRMTESLIGTISGGSGSNYGAAKDPIMRAAEYGETLTSAAVALITIFMVTTLGLTAATSVGSWMSPGAFMTASINSIVTPGMLALASFMYSGGAMLGVFLPLVPAVTFLTGVIGWFLQSVESIAAAPIVAIGLIMPESKDEIWGRAQPAYMLIMNLFLRPALMIVGLGAAMILTWILADMLNIAFIILVNVSFKIETMFGYVTIMLAYSGLLLYMVTEAYSLVIMVPNKVLHWIGDQSMAVKGPEQALQGAKADVEKGAQAMGGGGSAGTAGAGQGGQQWEKAEAYDTDQGLKLAKEAKSAAAKKNAAGGGGGGGGGATPPATPPAVPPP